MNERAVEGQVDSPSGALSAASTTPPHGFLKSHFAPAFFFLPSENRRALQTVYAFFRVLDDAVDLPGGDPKPLLAAWRRFLQERRPQDLKPWGQDALAAELLGVIGRFGIPEFALSDFIDKGVSVDMTENRFETPMDTEGYCYGVAGTVGIACLPIFGVPVEEAKDFAVRLGIAVQWINIIRDVGADASMNRIYLPKDHLVRFGSSEADILARRPSEPLLELLRFEAGVARSHYHRAQELLPQQWKKALRPALIMSGIYVDLLSKIERRGFPVFTKRVSLNIVEKATSTWRTLRNNK